MTTAKKISRIYNYLYNKKDVVIVDAPYLKAVKSLTAFDDGDNNKCWIAINYKALDSDREELCLLEEECSNEGMGLASLKHIRAIFNQALELAFKQEMIPKNWTDYTEMPRKRQKDEVLVFTREEQEKIINALEINPIGVMILLAISTGAREGELLGLDWKYVDFDEKIIEFKQALVKERIFSEDGRTVIRLENRISVVKTLTSNRIVPMSDRLCHVLKQYKLIQRSFIRESALDQDIPNLVFVSATGTYWDQSNMIKHYKKFLKDLGIPYRKFHTLRHTFATRIMEANVHPKIAQELLGHSSVDITMNVYSHVLPEQKREAIEKIKGII